MSKERARRREAREREAAVVAAARAGKAERRERQRARQRGRGRFLDTWLPRRPSRPTGVLARRHQRQRGVTVTVVLAVNLLVWVTFSDWPARAMVIVVSLLVTPVLHTMLFRRR